MSKEEKEERKNILKNILGAKVEIKYCCTFLSRMARGIYRGCQPLSPEDRYFAIVEIDAKREIDRLIPFENIIHINILEAPRVEKEEEEGDSSYYR